MKVKTIIQWQDPDGGWHEPGRIEDITVFDLADLIKVGTVEPVASADSEPASKTQRPATPPARGEER